MVCCWFGPSPPSAGQPSVGPPSAGLPQMSLFFFSLSRPFALCLSLSGCLLVEFWWCLKRRGAQMCTFGVLGLSYETPAQKQQQAQAAAQTAETTNSRGISVVLWFFSGYKHNLQQLVIEFIRSLVKKHDSPRAQKCTFQGPAFNHVAGEGKKRAIFGSGGRGRRVSGGGSGGGGGESAQNPRKFFAGKYMAQKTRQQIVPKSSPTAKGFLGSRMVRKV